jgi:hypothetical protein
MGTTVFRIWMELIFCRCGNPITLSRSCLRPKVGRALPARGCRSRGSLESARQSWSRSVTGENKVPSLCGLVARGTALERRLVGRFAVVELSERPTVGRGVFARILDHELDPFLGRPGHEGLGTAKSFVVLLRRDKLPSQTGNDRAIRKWKLSLPEGFDGEIIAQNGAQIVEAKATVCDRRAAAL